MFQSRHGRPRAAAIAFARPTLMNAGMDLDHSHPSIADLERAARRRIPHFVWEFLDSGTGADAAARGNVAALDAVRLMPAVLRGAPEPDLSSTLFGQRYALPFGIAPVGMSGLIWPDAERILARTALREGIPYCMSSMAAKSTEEMAGEIGEIGWFQLYAPGEPEIRRDFLARARDAGFRVMVLTLDVPVASRRERQRRADIRQPPAITPRIAMQCALRPRWTLETLRHGKPTLAMLARYADVRASMPGTAHLGYQLRTAPDWDYLKAVRDEWQGPLVVKGVMDPAPVEELLRTGVDGLWVSNHGGRQFDAAPPAIEALPAVRAAAGAETPILFDSGVRSGTHVLAAIARGADFVMLGRAFHYGLGALGRCGAGHVLSILKNGISADMGQMGISRPADARGRLA